MARFFALGFFHESSSPMPEKITLGSFKFFRKFVEIFESQGAPLISMTLAVNFATATATVVDTGGKFAVGFNDTGGKLHTFVFTLDIICKHNRKMK